ncbi:DNA (cytosine-5-)-methyltransferase [Rhodococcus ruber]|uniref:DNA cytosine methyltransferase n=1 Tax=Rhodococcus TaxID=1827 RepID=UPI00029B3BD4|nr:MULTISPECIES: DNA (cytosine-5-)-methyltransferase [Rhodococcus]ATQ31577.1 DNA (cytosine-5-)-methyltransferase [Rhodococcus ruber]
MSGSVRDGELEVIEICAGAGGQSLGLERAGFSHRLAVELDPHAAATLTHNLGKSVSDPGEIVKVGDAADSSVLDPAEHVGIDLFAGGVPCPPFSIAGKQLGANDERDLFAWAVEMCGRMKPKALLLENVRGLSGNRFSAYRQHVLDQLREYGYIGEWRLLHASDFGVAQLRPRFVLIALQPEYAEYFSWPEPIEGPAPTVGEVLRDLMGVNGWEDHHVDAWVRKANTIAPTIVGGSKKHGGADLGPTRAKRAWAELGVDAMGVADAAPSKGWVVPEGKPGPKLTNEMVARIQGWYGEFTGWEFLGKKTSVYRQIGNAFPPPVAKALGVSIRDALLKTGTRRKLIEDVDVVHDPIYTLLRSCVQPLTVDQICARLSKNEILIAAPEVERRIANLSRDFEITTTERSTGTLAFRLGEFFGFVGQESHMRHELFALNRSKIS